MAPGPALLRPPALVSPAAPARPVPSSTRGSPSASPFRYVRLAQTSPPPHPLAIDHPLQSPADDGADSDDDDDDGDDGDAVSPAGSKPVLPRPLRPRPLLPLPLPPPPPPPQLLLLAPRRQGVRIPDRLKPWLGIASWAATSAAFVLAIAFWRKDVFAGLDRLALYLQSRGAAGYALLFALIFVTTIPPLPLYSTLIILSGYTYGTWAGALLSYGAALAGASAVFLATRRMLRGRMARALVHAPALQRIVRAVERRPALLLLIRVAPYPYNVLNVLLAASHALAFRTFFVCTALSLAKVVVHTSVGASMHSFAEDTRGAGRAGARARVWTAAGLVLCAAILVYLASVARRAVDAELDADAAEAAAEAGDAEEMREAPLPAHTAALT